MFQNKTIQLNYVYGLFLHLCQNKLLIKPEELFLISNSSALY